MRWPVIAILATLCACSLPFSPEGAQPFDPPPIFTTWWAEMEACSRTQGDLSRVRWLSVPTANMRSEDAVYFGYWVSPHTIYLNSEIPFPTTGEVPFSGEWRERTVRHEMLHALMGFGHGPAFDDCGVR